MQSCTMCFTAFALSFDIMHIIFYFGWLAGCLDSWLDFRAMDWCCCNWMWITNDNHDDNETMVMWQSTGRAPHTTLEPPKPIRKWVWTSIDVHIIQRKCEHDFFADLFYRYDHRRAFWSNVIWLEMLSEKKNTHTYDCISFWYLSHLVNISMHVNMYYFTICFFLLVCAYFFVLLFYLSLFILIILEDHASFLLFFCHSILSYVVRKAHQCIFE